MSVMMTSRIALVALLAAGPTTLWAQTATAPATDGTVTVTETAPAGQTEQAAQPVEGQIRMQSEDTVLADDLIGSSVYSTEGETIGNISDMIINLDGTVDGIVIGVGGFLGIGQKSVAIEMSSLSFVADPDSGDIRLQSSSTRDDLEAAPEFVTKEDQDAAAQMPATGTTVPADGTAPATGTGTVTTTAPADTTAPATVTTVPADGSATTGGTTTTTTPPADATAPATDTTAPAGGTAPTDGTTPPASN